jgi:hypothetical protein
MDFDLPMLLDEDVELIDNILPGVDAGLDSGIITQEDQVILQQAEDPAAYNTTTSCLTAEQGTPGSAISVTQDHSWAASIIFPPLPFDGHQALHEGHDDDDDDDAGPILYDIDLW